jgi:hypothetical protein
VTSEEAAEIKRLRAESAELRRANEILKAASALFASIPDCKPIPSWATSEHPEAGEAVCFRSSSRSREARDGQGVGG